jgi:cytochrome c553
VLADFSLWSHHVGNGDAYIGGTMTDNDCAVCHAEATVSAQGGQVAATAGLHKNGYIDLRDADDNTKYYEYDVNSIKGLAAASANSGNATWKEQMSGLDQIPTLNDGVGAPDLACAGTVPSGYACTTGLDRFCLSCHDGDGASAAYAKGDTTPITAQALNPFADTKISNAYDRQVRCPAPGNGATSACTTTVGINPTEMRVVNVAQRVDEQARTTGGTLTTPADRDNGWTVGTSPVRGQDFRYDPPEGVFSRHAIRGLSVSPYGTAATNFDASANWTSTIWKSTSVMACADCHTVDGVNQGNGNAHGSRTEYLLKNADGTAAAVANSATTVVCARCHAAAVFVGGVHTNNAGDFQWKAGLLGTAGRVPTGTSGGNIYGFACGNCHGGSPVQKPGVTYPSGSTGAGGFGTIHGTSQVVGIQTSTGTARPAYRFTNGNSMRFYNPGDWATTATRTCYTLGNSGDAGAATDNWGGCTKHSGSGTGASDDKATATGSPGLRPLRY